MINDEHYMERCLQLALLGEGYAAPNPMVGAVLVHNDLIIGEGYHQVYGGPHAEVNCFNSVLDHNRKLIAQSTLYVSLEPCAHYGKMPPCADRIVLEQVKKVVIACRDPFAKVNGQGIEKLKAAGIEVKEAVLQDEAIQLNKRFFLFHLKKRPYIFLKWAQTNDGFIAGADYNRVAISNELTNRFTHHIRTTAAAIMIGTNTAVHDQPSLTSRLWPGNNPVRILIDKHLQISTNAVLFNNDVQVVAINYIKEETKGNTRFLKVTPEENIVEFILDWLYKNDISSLLVEGGTTLLQSFLDAGKWDEAIVIRNTSLILAAGVAAPKFSGTEKVSRFKLRTDSISIYKNE